LAAIKKGFQSQVGLLSSVEGKYSRKLKHGSCRCCATALQKLPSLTGFITSARICEEI
jgi:hypothetical protein